MTLIRNSQHLSFIATLYFLIIIFILVKVIIEKYKIGTTWKSFSIASWVSPIFLPNYWPLVSVSAQPVSGLRVAGLVPLRLLRLPHGHHGGLHQLDAVNVLLLDRPRLLLHNTHLHALPLLGTLRGLRVCQRLEFVFPEGLVNVIWFSRINYTNDLWESNILWSWLIFSNSCCGAVNVGIHPWPKLLRMRRLRELLTSARHDQLTGSVYLTAWMIIRMTRYTVITVARLHTPEHTNTKMQTLCRLPSSSQQWLPPPPLDSSMMRPELATRGSVLLVTRAMGVTRILHSAPTPRLLTLLSRKFFTRPWRLKMRTFTAECLTQLFYEVGLCFCMGWPLNSQSL